ncbi:hypothetical protein [Falsiporphyromonas endometrii]|uniref:Fibronectin type-III domain-containing protein n=1 Tax=Falsiporphyromonas endometrii TaxID=1387297 RepID=A0ABV9K7F6_9PORP
MFSIKRKNFPLLLLGCILFCSFSFVNAQSNSTSPKRSVIFLHSMNPLTYWSSQIDSIVFLDYEADLKTSIEVTPVLDTVGKAHVIIPECGPDVTFAKFVLPEDYKVNPEWNDEDIWAYMSSDIAYNIDPHKSYDLTGLQRTETYVAMIAGVDKYGYLGKPYKYEFTMPDYKLEGDPVVDVKFYDPTTVGITVDLVPNDDCMGYFFFASEPVDPDKEEFGLKLKQRVIAFGKDFKNPGSPYMRPVKGLVYNSFLPSSDYALYLVMVDANGQYSDLITHPFRTANKGTDKEAKTHVEVSEITATSARVKVTPDENTSVFRSFLVVKELYDTDKELREYVDSRMDEPNSMYNPLMVDPDDWVWNDLYSDTEYYVVSRAKNALSEWGPLQKVVFKTLPSNAQSFSLRGLSKEESVILRGSSEEEPDKVEVIDIRKR